MIKDTMKILIHKSFHKILMINKDSTLHLTIVFMFLEKTMINNNNKNYKNNRRNNKSKKNYKGSNKNNKSKKNYKGNKKNNKNKKS